MMKKSILSLLMISLLIVACKKKEPEPVIAQTQTPTTTDPEPEPDTPTEQPPSTTVSDIDGNQYNFVVIGTQTWMKENLRTTKYCNGDAIANVTDATAWNNLSSGAWAHYSNDNQYDSSYGKLYNGYVVDDARNICPCGWHVPTDAEWTVLTNYLDNLGDEGLAGGKMKSTGTQYWQYPNTGATNESGFSGLPGGLRLSSGAFVELGQWAYWWSSTNSGQGVNSNLFRSLAYYDGAVYPGFNYNVGFSVRCLKN
jgi:uncharacterized protein (TIGR02145 family)